MRFSYLCEKEVINICDGQRLGYVSDLELDGCGKVLALLVNTSTKLFSFGKEKCICIPWDRIERIGEDTVLVAHQTDREEQDKHKETKM